MQCTTGGWVWLLDRVVHHWFRESTLKPTNDHLTIRESNWPCNIYVLKNAKVPEHDPWLLRKPSVMLRLTELRRSGTHPFEYQWLHVEIQDQFEDHLSIYTDGSKDQNRVAAAAVCQWKKFGVCMLDESSIITAEA